MKVDICVTIRCNDLYCHVKCPYFKILPGASFERPLVEHCSLFQKDLRILNKDILRCPECNKEQRDWYNKMRKFTLREKCQCKPSALKLMELTNWEVDIWEYETPKTLLDDLIDRYGLTGEQLKELLDIDQDTLDQLLAGKQHPYLLRCLQAHFNYPKVAPITYVELLQMRAQSFEHAAVTL